MGTEKYVTAYWQAIRAYPGIKWQITRYLETGNARMGIPEGEILTLLANHPGCSLPVPGWFLPVIKRDIRTYKKDVHLKKVILTKGTHCRL